MEALSRRRMIQEMFTYGPRAMGVRSRMAASDTEGVHWVSHHANVDTLTHCVVIAVRSEKRVYHAPKCECYEMRHPLQDFFEELKALKRLA